MLARLSLSPVLSQSYSCIGSHGILWRTRRFFLSFFLVVQVLHPKYVTDILCLFHVGAPDVPGDQFHMVLSCGALAEVKTGFAALAVTLVFPLSLTACCGVLQDFVCRADVAIIVFIVNVLMFPEESFLRHRSIVGKQGLNFIIQEEFRNSRCFLSMCDPVFINLFLQLLFVEKSFFLSDLLLELVAIGTSFYMGCIDNYFTRINQSGIDTGLQKL